MSFTVSDWHHWGRQRPDADLRRPRRPDLCRRGEQALADGRLLEAERLFTWLMESPEAVDEMVRCQALAGLGRLARMNGQHRHAEGLLERALEIASRRGLDCGRILYDLGLIAATSGREEEARSRFKAVIADKRTTSTAELGAAMNELAAIYARQEKWFAVEVISRRAARVMRRAGDDEGRLTALLAMARAIVNQDRPAQARAALRTALRLSHANRWWRQTAEAALLAGETAERLGRYGEANSWYRWASGVARRANWDNTRARGLLGLGRLAFMGRRAPQAYEHLREAAALFSRTHDPERLSETLQYLEPIRTAIEHRASNHSGWARLVTPGWRLRKRSSG